MAVEQDRDSEAKPGSKSKANDSAERSRGGNLHHDDPIQPRCLVETPHHAQGTSRFAGFRIRKSPSPPEAMVSTPDRHSSKDAWPMDLERQIVQWMARGPQIQRRTSRARSISTFWQDRVSGPLAKIVKIG